MTPDRNRRETCVSFKIEIGKRFLATD